MPVIPEPAGHYVSHWGEGPIWHQDALYYVDIEGHKILRFNPQSGEEKIWDIGERVGTVVPRARGGLVFAGASGFAFLDEASGGVTPIADPEAHLANTRFNDGKCDPAGRFWAGTIDLNSPRQPIASLYCLEADLSFSRKFSGVANSNGLAWPQDNKTLYYIDTPRKNVLAFDYDVTTGEIHNERIAFDTSYLSGNPDGMTIDRDDHLWIAFCRSGMIRCMDPANGRVLDEIAVPVDSVTACAFGGPELRDLYITTGKADHPLAGRVFVARPGATGCAAYAFAG